MGLTELKLSKEQIQDIIDLYEPLTNKLLYYRKYKEANASKRDAFHRDYTRILYSASFRRLQGKMQIMGINPSAFYRNRLTHSLEVSQIATSIARTIYKTCFNSQKKKSIVYALRDLYLIEAAALGHDIGHPAFGHKGERVLDEIGSPYGKRFEGNAQNFRVLRHLEKKSAEFNGLNLTYRTLLAINKYLVCETPGVSKFMYKEDFEELENFRQKVGLQNKRTLDVQIIELADDIAYAVHDLEDGLALRNFSIEEILFMLKQAIDKKIEGLRSSDGFNDPARMHQITDEISNLDEAYKVFESMVEEAQKDAAEEKSNIQNHFKVFRTRLTSILTNHLVHYITLGKVNGKEAKEHGTAEGELELMFSEPYKSLISVFNKAVFQSTTRDTDLYLYEMRGEVVLKSLFAIYTDPIANKDCKLMPPEYRLDDISGMNEQQKVKARVRNVMDYLAGMMDTFAISEFERLFYKGFDEIDIAVLPELNEKLEKRSKA